MLSEESLPFLQGCIPQWDNEDYLIHTTQDRRLIELHQYHRDNPASYHRDDFSVCMSPSDTTKSSVDIV